MQERFKKNKSEWMEDFFKAVSSRNILKQSLDPPDPSKPNEPLFTSRIFKQYTFETKGTERTIGPPELVFTTDPDLVPAITDKSTRTRRTVQASLLSDSTDSPFTRLQQLSPENSEDLGSLQESKDAFCVGLSLVKQDGILKTQQRVEYEFRCLSERSGAKYKIEEQNGRLGDLWKVLSRLMRIFIVVQERQKRLKIGRLMFYPKVDISLRKVKITPFTFVESPALRKLQRTNFAKQAITGYVSLASQGNNTFKFLLLQPHQFQNNPVPVVGLFVAGKLGGSLKQDCILWSLVTQFITNPNIRRRLSMKGDRTGLLVSFDENGKNTNFLFEISQNARWSISTNIEICNAFPLQHRFSTRQVIIQEQKQESQVESVQSRPNFVQNPPDSFSSRSYDSRDHEIARLKSQLQLYKNHCQELKQIIATLSYQKSVPFPQMPMSMPIPLQTMQNPQNFTSNFNYKPQQPVQFQANDYPPEPFFGCLNPQTINNNFEPDQPSKEFRVKDSKNISFAQENQYEEQVNIESILANSLDDSDFISPQFKQLRKGPASQTEVRPFSQKQREIKSAFPQNSLKKASTLPEPRQHIESPRNFKEKQAPPANIERNFMNKSPPKPNIYSQRQTDKDPQDIASNLANKYASSGSKINDSKGLQLNKETVSNKYREKEAEKVEEKQNSYQSSRQTDIYKKYKTGDDNLIAEKPSSSAVPPKKVQEPVKERSVSPLPEGRYKLLQDSDSDEDQELAKITQKYRKK